jgi:hypothetical protein
LTHGSSIKCAQQAAKLGAKILMMTRKPPRVRPRLG